jgi:cation diffusion facilitator CzcD-associated flavoprotein CzcO
VSILDTPIERITPKGLRTSEKDYEFDIIIYATGFDAITGSFDHIDIRGSKGLPLKRKWSGGPQTFVGVMVEDFPNMFMVMGPHTALGNIPRSIEYNVEWINRLIGFMRERGLTHADATAKSMADWTGFVREKAEGLLSNEIDSWMTGVNQNVEGKQTRILARYSGSAPDYRKRCDAVAEGGFRELTLS